MLRPAVNRQPGYRRRGLVELDTIPNDFQHDRPTLDVTQKESSEAIRCLEDVFVQGPETCSIDFN